MHNARAREIAALDGFLEYIYTEVWKKTENSNVANFLNFILDMASNYSYGRSYRRALKHTTTLTNSRNGGMLRQAGPRHKKPRAVTRFSESRRVARSEICEHL